jgi:hypothetical protein
MGFLQRWLDEPDEDIARYAKQFYVLTYTFMVTFLLQVVQVVWRAGRGTGNLEDFVGPCISLFLTLVMYCLALDGRRSYKAMKARAEMKEQTPPSGGLSIAGR